MVPGAVAFRLHDTYGFPVELTAEIAAERGFGLDRDGFTAEMEAQRRRARAAWKGGPDEAGAPVYRAILDRSGPTEFVGYDRLDEVGRILSIVREGEAVEEAEAGQLVEVYLDRTPFYAESGGQVGDTGSLATESGRARVDDTQLPMHGLHGHHAEVTEGTLRVGQEATLSRRSRPPRAHPQVAHRHPRTALGAAPDPGPARAAGGVAGRAGPIPLRLLPLRRGGGRGDGRGGGGGERAGHRERPGAGLRGLPRRGCRDGGAGLLRRQVRRAGAGGGGG